jgi:hypothetical protein
VDHCPLCEESFDAFDVLVYHLVAKHAEPHSYSVGRRRGVLLLYEHHIICWCGNFYPSTLDKQYPTLVSHFLEEDCRRLSSRTVWGCLMKYNCPLCYLTSNGVMLMAEHLSQQHAPPTTPCPILQLPRYACWCGCNYYEQRALEMHLQQVVFDNQTLEHVMLGLLGVSECPLTTRP